MSKFSRSWAAPWFYVLLVVTLTVYILRGMAVLSMLPGSILWILLLLSLAMGLLGLLQSLR